MSKDIVGSSYARLNFIGEEEFFITEEIPISEDNTIPIVDGIYRPHIVFSQNIEITKIGVNSIDIVDKKFQLQENKYYNIDLFSNSMKEEYGFKLKTLQFDQVKSFRLIGKSVFGDDFQFMVRGLYHPLNDYGQIGGSLELHQPGNYIHEDYYFNMIQFGHYFVGDLHWGDGIEGGDYFSMIEM